MKILSFNRGIEQILSKKQLDGGRPGGSAFPNSKSLFQPIGSAIKLHLDEVFNVHATDWEAESFLRPDIKNFNIVTPEGYSKMFQRTRNFLDDYKPRNKNEAGKKQALSLLLNEMQDNRELFDTYRKALLQG